MLIIGKFMRKFSAGILFLAFALTILVSCESDGSVDKASLGIEDINTSSINNSTTTIQKNITSTIKSSDTPKNTTSITPGNTSASIPEKTPTGTPTKISEKPTGVASPKPQKTPQNNENDNSDILSVKLINETVIDSLALNFPDGTYGVWPNGNAYQQDGIVSFNNYQYAVYYDAGKRLCIARRKIFPGGLWEIIKFQDYLHTTNDTHNSVTIGIARGDGTIHISWGHHVSKLKYKVSAIGAATDPQSVTWNASLFSGTLSELEPGKTVSSLTYPRFIDMPDGGLMLMYRFGTSGNGDETINIYNANSHTWKQKGIFLSRKGNYEGSKSRNAYLDYPQYDKNGRLHVTFMWRETGGAESNHDIMYIYSDDNGDTWKNTNGALVGTIGSNPVNLNSSDIIVWNVHTHHGLLNQETMYVDDEGRVHIVTIHAPDNKPDYESSQAANAERAYYHYWRGQDGKWNQNKITDFIPGNRPKVLFDKKGNAFLIYRKGANFAIAAASGENAWTDWKIIYENKTKAFSEPIVDFYRWKNEEILSVFIQDTPVVKGEASSLGVYDFSTLIK